MFGIGEVIGNILGIGKTYVERTVKDVNKEEDHSHEKDMAHIQMVTEGEKQRNYFTPLSIIMYSMSFTVVYGIVIQPFAEAFGLDIPKVEFAAALKILVGLLGL